MPRRSRVVVPSVPHHLTQRGNERAVGFHDAQDYVIAARRRRAVSGHLWQGRFRSCPMDDSPLANALFSVERTPVRAGIVSCAWEYPWSSAAQQVVAREPSGLLDLASWQERWSPEAWREMLCQGEEPLRLQGIWEKGTAPVARAERDLEQGEKGAVPGVRGFLSLGSNLGDRRGNLRAAVGALRRTPGVRVTRVSSVYETAPQGVTDQPDFLNLVVAIETTLAARELLAAVKEIETRLGRTAGRRWGPRVVDIDILLLGDDHIREDGLTVPHPRMLERAFVMAPLAELEPGLDLGGERADAIAARLRKEQRINGHFPL